MRYVLLGGIIYLVTIFIVFCISYRLSVLYCRKMEEASIIAKLSRVYKPSIKISFLKALVWPIVILIGILER